MKIHKMLNVIKQRKISLRATQWLSHESNHHNCLPFFAAKKGKIGEYSHLHLDSLDCCCVEELYEIR